MSRAFDLITKINEMDAEVPDEVEMDSDISNDESDGYYIISMTDGTVVDGPFDEYEDAAYALTDLTEEPVDDGSFEIVIKDSGAWLELDSNGEETGESPHITIVESDGTTKTGSTIIVGDSVKTPHGTGTVTNVSKDYVTVDISGTSYTVLQDQLTAL